MNQIGSQAQPSNPQAQTLPAVNFLTSKADVFTAPTLDAKTANADLANIGVPPSEQRETLATLPEGTLVERATQGSLGELPKLLMITSIAGAGNCAANLGGQLKMIVDVAGSRRESLVALRGQAYAAILIDNAISDSDPQGAELLQKHAGDAVLLEVNFAISGVARLARQVRGEMERRKQANTLAMRAACVALSSELKETVAGLLLQSQLALGEPGVSPELTSKLKMVAHLAGELRRRLDLPLQPA